MDEYLSDLEKDLSNKKLDDFWVMCDSDFKAIKKSKTEVKKILKDKTNIYKNKKIANIRLFTNKKGLNNQDWIFAIKITVYEINENGVIDSTINSTWGVYIKYSEDELNHNKFKVNALEKLVKKVASKKLTSDMIMGINYSEIN
jgi:phage pi2 protein 07